MTQAWETITVETYDGEAETEVTERLPVPGGHLYKVVRSGLNTTIALCFVPMEEAFGCACDDCLPLEEHACLKRTAR